MTQDGSQRTNNDVAPVIHHYAITYTYLMQLQQVKASFKGQVKQLKASSILNYNSLLLRASIAFQDAPEQIELHYRPLPEKQDDPMVPLLGQKDF